MNILTLPLLLLPLVVARILQFPVDTYAFPKYTVTFLNALPLPNDIAHRWLRDGLRGGEREFLDQPWRIDDQVAMGIGSGDFHDHVSCPVVSPFLSSRLIPLASQIPHVILSNT